MKCNLCNHHCNTNRDIKLGFCQIDNQLYISYYGLHFGEEPYLVGNHGSGTIFFLGCTLRCLFCQNHQISRWHSGEKLLETWKKISAEELLEIIFDLQKQKAANINLVSPTPYVALLAPVLREAKKQGLKIPIVYNTHGYDSLESLALLDGLIDIYLPDYKYSDSKLAEKYSGAGDYPTKAKLTIREMFKQTGQLQIGPDGLAIKGTAIRHLVLPGALENSKRALDFLAEFGPQIHISLMAQYQPCGELPSELQRQLTVEEYNEIVAYAEKLGLENCLIQELESAPNYLPDFAMKDSFNNP